MSNIINNYMFDAFANASDNIYIYVTDMSTDCTRWSKGAVSYFGLEGEYIYDVKTKWIDYIHPDDRETFIEDISAVYNGTKSQHNCEYRARNRMGQYGWVECKGSMVYGEDGNPAFFAGIMTRIDNTSKYDSITHLLSGYELFKTTIHKHSSLMLLGIDNFRIINSRYGIYYGNKVLRYMARLLNAEFPDASIFRFNGDEFVVYNTTLSLEEMQFRFEKIHLTCKIAENLDDIYSFSISAGLVDIPGNVSSMSDIIKCAALSLADAKENSTNHLSTYSAEIKNRHLRRTKISEQLLASIKNNFEGFHLEFQPLLTSYNSQVIGAEALLRWEPDIEDIGSCSPEEFIPLLEKNEGIIDLGYYVMKESIKQLAKWQEKYPTLHISFNVSYLQLQDPLFIPSILKTCKLYNVNPHSIIVELTESILATDINLVRDSFKLLRTHGVRIALDDFGTGNTSFWTVHSIDIDILKLDQAFVRSLDDKDNKIDLAIVESISIMCNRLGYDLVAEGVESAKIRNKLQQFEITAYQGFLYSTPLPADKFEAYVKKTGAIETYM